MTAGPAHYPPAACREASRLLRVHIANRNPSIPRPVWTDGVPCPTLARMPFRARIAQVPRHRSTWIAVAAALAVAGASHAIALLVGLVAVLLGRLMGVKGEVSTLIGSGTAICGGSAIAAVAPAIGASSVSTAVSLSVVFVLNGVALFLFPWVGHRLVGAGTGTVERACGARQDADGPDAVHGGRDAHPAVASHGGRAPTRDGRDPLGDRVCDNGGACARRRVARRLADRLTIKHCDCSYKGAPAIVPEWPGVPGRLGPWEKGFVMTFPVLQDKVAIITGAAMDMGEATAKLFAEAGAKVVVADYSEELGQKVTDEINASGGTAHFVKVDISKSEQVQNMVAETVKVFGRLDCAANNAAMEYGPHNIRVNSVAPGAVDTPVLRGALEQFGLDPDTYAPQLSLLNRFADPREIAQGPLWLSSDAASYVTGTVLHVDAGYATGR